MSNPPRSFEHVNVAYVSTLCSPDAFSHIFAASKIKPQQQAQKFHALLASGLRLATPRVTAISRPPIAEVDSMLALASDRHAGIRFVYLPVARRRFTRHSLLFVSCLAKMIGWQLRSGGQRIIVCDVLNLSISFAALVSAKLLGAKSVAIVTDLPQYLVFTEKPTAPQRRGAAVFAAVYRGVCSLLMRYYDAYIVLTPALNGVVNVRGRPSAVVEGVCDPLMKRSANTLANKYPERVILYAGALHQKFGLKILLDAFDTLTDPDLRLFLFGSGDFEAEIVRRAQRDRRIVFFGVVPNDRVVAAQLRATLLVNPRPSIEDFVKYSFPSKNMECMASGTPLVTTKLPGIPADHVEHLYFFTEETALGIARTLSELLSQSRQILHEKGMVAQEFVMEQKSSEVQARKLLALVA